MQTDTHKHNSHTHARSHTVRMHTRALRCTHCILIVLTKALSSNLLRSMHLFQMSVWWTYFVVIIYHTVYLYLSNSKSV